MSYLSDTAVSVVVHLRVRSYSAALRHQPWLVQWTQCSQHQAGTVPALYKHCSDPAWHTAALCSGNTAGEREELTVINQAQPRILQELDDS